MTHKLPPVPKDFPVQPLRAGDVAKDQATCGTCGRSWDDAIATGMTPAPAGRCPFEAFHAEPRKPSRDLFPYLSATYGARMGRSDYGTPDPDANPRVYLQAAHLNGGGYDRGGAYWGHGGGDVYACSDEWDTFYFTIRAHSRCEAKRKVREILPLARFFN